MRWMLRQKKQVFLHMRSMTQLGAPGTVISEVGARPNHISLALSLSLLLHVLQRAISTTDDVSRHVGATC